MARLGARRLILVGRSNISGDAVRKMAAKLAKRGAQIELKSCDLSDPRSLRALVGEITSAGHSLRGVIHAAVVYDDTPITSMTLEQFRKVVAVKAGAALELRAILADKPLDFLVFYSSVAVAFGNPSQANYVAANAVLDALAASDSRKQGPSVSLAWGAIGDVGQLARRTEMRALVEERLGVKTMSSENALADLGQFLSPRSTAFASGQIMIAELDWSVPALRIGCGLNRHSRFRDLATTTVAEASESGDKRSLIANMSHEEVLDLTLNMLAEQIGEVLRIPPEKLDRNRPITNLGMDSLTTLEWRMLAEKKFGFGLPIMMIAEGVTIARLAEHIRDTMLRSPSEEVADNRVEDLPAKHRDPVDVLGNGHLNGKNGDGGKNLL
jgi:acyl carrier protein